MMVQEKLDMRIDLMEHEIGGMKKQLQRFLGIEYSIEQLP